MIEGRKAVAEIQMGKPLVVGPVIPCSEPSIDSDHDPIEVHRFHL
jgi:hypothetical protein